MGDTHSIPIPQSRGDLGGAGNAEECPLPGTAAASRAQDQGPALGPHPGNPAVGCVGRAPPLCCSGARGGGPGQRLVPASEGRVAGAPPSPQAHCTGFSLHWLLLLQCKGSRVQASVAEAHGLSSQALVAVVDGLSGSMASGLLPDQGLNPSLLLW